MKIIECNLSSEFESVEILPLSDLHVGDSRMKTKMFKDFVKYVNDEPNRYVLCNGDLMNNAVKSSVSNCYEDCMTPNQQKKWLRKELYPIKDRILVILEGNHEARTSKDVDMKPLEDIADYLGIGDKYIDEEVILKVTFGKRAAGGKRQCYTIYATHGNGGGKRPGSAINNIEMLALGTEADIYVLGHIHKKIAYKNGYRKVDLQNNNVRETERLFVYTSHWSEFGGYAAKKMFTPSALGTVPIILQAKEKKMEALL
jgi:predicted phosphodiesterase